MKAAATREERAPRSDLFGGAAEASAVEPPAAPRPVDLPAPVEATTATAVTPTAPPKASAQRPAPRSSLPPQMPIARAAERSSTLTTLYIVMPYADRATGNGPPKWRPGPASSFPDPNRALKFAENCIGKGGTVGAIVGRQTADVDLGEWSEPEIIGRFGRTPELEG